MTDWGKYFKYCANYQKLSRLDFKISNVGSHGDGSMSETEVPIVTWGAGLSLNNEHLISSPVSINQADVAPLMATLIGIPIPVHSVVGIFNLIKKKCKK